MGTAVKSKKLAAVQEKGCVACGVCVKACPLDAITVHKGKYAVVKDKCIGCGKCAGICPACVITIIQREVEPDENKVLV